MLVRPWQPRLPGRSHGQVRIWVWDSGLPSSAAFEARPSPLPRNMSSAILNLTCCHWSLQRGSSVPLNSGSSQRPGCCLCPQTGLCSPPDWCCPTLGWPSGPQTPVEDLKMNKTTKFFKAIYININDAVPLSLPGPSGPWWTRAMGIHAPHTKGDRKPLFTVECAEPKKWLQHLTQTTDLN